jgi:hypothetical protein
LLANTFQGCLEQLLHFVNILLQALNQSSAQKLVGLFTFFGKKIWGILFLLINATAEIKYQLT